MKCQHCGVELPNRAEYCHKCGMPQASISSEEKLPKRIKQIDRSIGKEFKRISAAFAVFLAVILGSGFVYNAGNISVPDLEGKELAAAEKALLKSDVDKADIEFRNENGLKIIDRNETIYVAIDQEPDADVIIRKGEKVVVTCEDHVEKVETAFEECLDENVNESDVSAEKLDFDPIYLNKQSANVTETLETNSKTQNENYIVDEVKSIDFDKNEVTFVIDTEEHLNDRAKKQLSACKDKPLTSAIETAESIRYDCNITTPEATDFALRFSSLTQKEQADYIVTDVEQINYTDHVVRLNADTKTHIEAVKREKKFLKSLKKKIPYKGLGEEYIGKTLVGEPDEVYPDPDSDYEYEYNVEEDDENEETEYTWMSDDGEYETLVVVCRNGKVHSVSKKDPDIFWTSSGKPHFSADKDKILEKRERAEKKASTRSSGSSGSSSGGGKMVYLPKYGEKYHYNPRCSNMSNPRQVTLSEAEEMGYGPCHNCVL